jgi:hypothetical protein
VRFEVSQPPGGGHRPVDDAVLRARTWSRWRAALGLARGHQANQTGAKDVFLSAGAPRTRSSAVAGDGETARQLEFVAGARQQLDPGVGVLRKSAPMTVAVTLQVAAGMQSAARRPRRSPTRAFRLACRPRT